ncbi:short subunit dehydrogenase [Williamsia limnetica]|uniref:Short subunit dehydrogenase n=1 Tax=Williamsia limnetica TaxID=882452 RepID=A0A318RB49_WILLI|nr:short subunit dehydrogenase [Williamsia limnetica]
MARRADRLHGLADKLSSKYAADCTVVPFDLATDNPGETLRAQVDGDIINVSRTTGFQPVPSLAVYSAPTAFVLSCSQSLWFEAQKHGITAFTLAPGPTTSEFFDVISDGASVVGSFQTAVHTQHHVGE